MLHITPYTKLLAILTILLLIFPPSLLGAPGMARSAGAIWELEESSGTRYDSVTQGVGPAAQFTAANLESLSIADNAALSTGNIDFTVTGWFYFDSIGSNDTTILSKAASVSGNDEYQLYVQFNAFKFLISADGNVTGACTAGTSCIVTDSTVLTTNTWYFVVAWYDSGAGQIRIRVNDSTTVSQTFASGPSDRTAPFSIGDKVRGFRFFDGRSQNVGFWKRVLTAQERTDLYNSGKANRYNGNSFEVDTAGTLTTSLIAYWTLDEASGTRYDSKGANHLTDNNTVTQNVGINGTASAQFTAANGEYLSIPDNASLSTGDIDFTVAAWAYLDSKAADRCIVCKWDLTAGNNAEYILDYQNGNDAFRFVVTPNGASGSSQSVIAFNARSPATSNWFFVVGWHDSANDQISISVNNGPPNTLPYSSGLLDKAAAFKIGRNDTTNDFNGRIDQVMFFKRVLTEAERTALWNEGVGQNYTATQREFRKRSFY